MTGPSLVEKIRRIHGALGALPHAFGGALALAYYAEPRATIDVDLNVFVAPVRLDEVLAPLSSLGVAADPDTREVVMRDGQARVWWASTPLDLFFAYDPFHAAAARRVRSVPFDGSTIPILAPEHLLVCKAIFDRPKDWVDIDAVLTLGTAVDTAEVLRWVGRIAGDDDPRYDRVAAILTAPKGR